MNAAHAVTTAWTPVAISGIEHRLPLLYVGERIEWSVYEFFATPRVRTLTESALQHRAQAIRALYTYYVARSEPLLNANSAIDLYEEFANALIRGTVKDGVDPLGLFWTGMKHANAQVLLSAVTEFSEFLAESVGGPSLNPSVSIASTGLGRSYVRHLQLKKANSVFSHLKNIKAMVSEARIPGGRANHWRQAGGSAKRPPPSFPENLVNQFFSKGLRRKKIARKTGSLLADNYNVRDFLYFLLLMFGGLRSGEPLHLFVEDIQPDPEQGAVVYLWHPEEGPAPEWSVHGLASREKPESRREYLARRYGLHPRNSFEMRGMPEAVGWKNLLLEETVPRVGVRSRVYWQNAAVGRLFWQLHSIYMKHIRPRTDNHPYYFVSLDRSAFGRPWKESSAKDAFDAAIRRIGLEPNSSEGLCRHAMRHRLGYYLARNNVDPQAIQIFLHHQSIASQEVYKKLRPHDVNEMLSVAHSKREAGVSDFDTGSLGINWKSDPLRIFEGPTDRVLKKLLALGGGSS